jgi:hypothetical protein
MTVRVQRLCSQTHGLVRDFVIRAIDGPGESFNDRITRRPEPGTAIRHERCCSSAFLLHVRRSLVNGDIIWAPAIDGAFVLTMRGGDFDLQLGTDVSIGYTNHDADTVQLYLQETLTFLVYTAEASVALT